VSVPASPSSLAQRIAAKPKVTAVSISTSVKTRKYALVCTSMH
jgi:hypothetical protein